MKTLILFLFSCVPFQCYAQSDNNYQTDNPQKTYVDSTIHECVSEYFNDSIMFGLSIGIVKEDLEFFYNYGSIDKEKSTLPTPITIYEIGSITKTFTGILLAQAVLDHKIKLENDIRDYLSEDYKNLEYNGVPIKIINLANHTAGLPEDIYADTLYKMKNPSMYDIMKVYEGDRGSIFSKGLQKVKLETEPGTRIHYSNTGIMLLGIILENVYGTSYSELLNKYITNPLKMPNTNIVFFESDTANYTKGYDKAGNIMPHIVFQIAGAAGGIKSTIQDMVQYVKANLAETNYTIKLSHEITAGTNENGIGLGWQISKNISGTKQLWHDGGEPGFSSYCLIVPSKKIGIICLINQRGRQMQLQNLSEKIILRIQ